MLKSFSQRDPQWSNLLLQPSKLTMGRYGCTTTCIADLSTYFGDNWNPGDINKHIRYTPDGLIIWQSCNFPHFEFWFRQAGRHDVDIKNAIADPDIAVILNVANGSHWVVATGILNASTYKIADPWLGDRADTMRYQNSITGAAYFKRKK